MITVSEQRFMEVVHGTLRDIAESLESIAESLKAIAGRKQE